ncbi:unnamed protein product [Adineta ricciae]|nr:unnamed protein product [Adineta ricciae]
MNYDDAKNSISQLQHFFTGIKYQIIDNIIHHPQGTIRNAWEIYIIHTTIYHDFCHATFGRYIHYIPTTVDDKGQLCVYNKLKNFGINNLNETVWLLASEHHSSLTTWDNYYKDSKSVLTFNLHANRFLKAFIEKYNPPSDYFKVLDIAMGRGRNSIWLARKGYQVVGFDASIEGIQIVKYQAERFNLTNLQSYVASIEEFSFGLEQWDLVVCMYFPLINQTSYLRRIEQSLKNEGLLIVEGFHWDSLSGEHRIPTGVTYRTNAIPSLFPNLTTIVNEEPVDYSDFGNEMTKLVRYVGQKHHFSVSRVN